MNEYKVRKIQVEMSVEKLRHKAETSKMNADMNECVFRGDVWTYQCKDRKKVNERRTDELLKALVPVGCIYGCIPHVKMCLCVNLCHQSGCLGGAEARGYHLIVS